MAELMLMKTPAGALVPVDEESAALLAKFKVGQGVKAEVKRARNLTNHRRFFALAKLCFDMWEPAALEYKGELVAKDFDRFRRDLLILAGHFHAVTNLRGEIRLEAKSISFANLAEDEFLRVYRSVLEVAWRKILKEFGYQSPEAVDAVVENLLRFE